MIFSFISGLQVWSFGEKRAIRGMWPLISLYHGFIFNTVLLQYLTSVSLIVSFTSVFFPADYRNKKMDSRFQ